MNGSSIIVSIIVVSYNTKEMTLNCLKSISLETNLPYELIVIDNGSQDESASAIRRDFPNAILIDKTSNQGFAKANNIAAKIASGRYLLLLNSDTIILDRAIERLVRFAHERPKALIWGGRTVFPDGTLNPSSCWRKMSLWNIACRTLGLTGIFKNSRIFNSEAYGGWDRNTEREVDIVQGCFLLISRRNWEILGGFDEAFFMYGEEADLCLRARKILGAQPRFTPNASIIHYGGDSHRIREERMIMLMKAKAEIIQRHLPKWQRPLALSMFRLWPFSRSMALRAIGILGINHENKQHWRALWRRRAEWESGIARSSSENR